MGVSINSGSKSYQWYPWTILENPLQMDDLAVLPIWETLLRKMCAGGGRRAAGDVEELPGAGQWEGTIRCCATGESSWK